MRIATHLESRLLVVFALALAAGCAMFGPPTAERYVPPPVGTTWERSQVDTGSFGSGASKLVSRRGESTWQGERVLTFEGTAGGLNVFAKQDGSWIGLFKGATPAITFDPPQNWQYPLEVGKSWTREQRVTFHPTNRTVAFGLTQKVEAYERVTVPAGTYNAFKVSSVSSLGEESQIWFSPELGIFVKQSQTRSAKHPQGAGTREVELVSYKPAN